MNKTLVSMLALVVFVTGAFAISFTDTDKAENHGKTGLKNLTKEIDANFAQIESGKFVQAQSTNSTQILSESVTMHAGTVSTNTFSTAFKTGTVPKVVCTYTEDPGDVRPIYISSVTASNFTAVVEADKNFAWIAVGQQQ